MSKRNPFSHKYLSKENYVTFIEYNLDYFDLVLSEFFNDYFMECENILSMRISSGNTETFIHTKRYIKRIEDIYYLEGNSHVYRFKYQILFDKIVGGFKIKFESHIKKIDEPDDRYQVIHNHNTRSNYFGFYYKITNIDENNRFTLDVSDKWKDKKFCQNDNYLAITLWGAFQDTNRKEHMYKFERGEYLSKNVNCVIYNKCVEIFDFFDKKSKK